MKKKLFAGLLASLLLFQAMGNVSQAVKIVEVPTEEVESVYNQAIDSNKLKNWPEGPHIYSESGIVMDMDTGSVLYGKKIDDKHYPASITKVLTALVSLENCELDSVVKHSRDDVLNLESGATHIGIKENEEISMKDALYAILLASANEVSNGIASNFPGGYDAFVEEMNATARELGCENSNFMNPHGLHHDEHYTTAYDMALISAAAFQNETFQKITSTKQYTIGKTNITKEERTFQQKHKMLNSGSHHYEYCVGGKTGYTTKSLNTLVTFATKGNMNLVAVVIRTHGGNSHAYEDTKKILDYAFENFQKRPVQVPEIAHNGIAAMGKQAFLTLPNQMLPVMFSSYVGTYEDPTELGDKTGIARYTYDGWKIGNVEYIISDMRYREIHNIEEPSIEPPKSQKKDKTSNVVWIVLIILVIVLLGVVGLFLYVEQKRKELEKVRKERRKKILEEWEKNRTSDE